MSGMKGGQTKHMPRNIERDIELRKERCEQILSAAVELFATNGLVATKISDIAQKAQMSHGLVYNYFHSKEEIYISILEKNLSRLTCEVERVNAQPIPANEKLAIIAEQFQTGRWNEAVFHQIFIGQFFNSEHVSQDLKNSVRTKLDENVGLIASIFQEGQSNGIFISEDPRQLAFLYLSALHSIVIAAVRGLTLFDKPFDHQIVRLFLRKSDSCG